MEVQARPTPLLPDVMCTTDGTTEDDPYYAKLGEFYSEWITLKEENEKTKDEEEEKPFRFCWGF